MRKFSQRSRLTASLCIVPMLLLPCSLTAAEATKPKVVRDIEFAVVDGHSLKLDLHMPSETADSPLVVWIHGGGWRNGSKERCQVHWLTKHGFTVASISYRLSSKGTFPDQIHDCKAAVRWLRANANKYGFSTARIAVAGSSAGGHLAALLGTTADVEELEGTVGGNLDQSSHVDAIVDYFGPTDFVLRSKTQPDKTTKKNAPVRLLLGGPVDEKIELARLASPALHVTSDDPPLLIFHGKKDRTVLFAQSERIVEEYNKVNRLVTLHALENAGHAGGVFYREPNQTRLVNFLDKHLRPKKK
ncbi:alpha/beta hydrolase [Thalassoroseus pseudoceratinae]|uniref:alpha/beta hydrolase n=1 Tax=Thalassoroseus pseudoceratinae TaxID=2713176 RepID=UPI00198022C5|nr:alpha/beta hydrolase [Thalassoroseus pseudoceratinae]